MTSKIDSHLFTIVEDPCVWPLVEGFQMSGLEVAEMLKQKSFVPGTVLKRGCGRYVLSSDNELVGKWVRYKIGDKGRLVRSRRGSGALARRNPR